MTLEGRCQRENRGHGSDQHVIAFLDYLSPARNAMVAASEVFPCGVAEEGGVAGLGFKAACSSLPCEEIGGKPAVTEGLPVVMGGLLTITGG